MPFKSKRDLPKGPKDVLPTRELLTHRYLLEELPLAVRDMEDRPEGFLKCWICYE